MSLSEYQRLYQRLELRLADRPMSENDKIDMLDAYKAYLDALITFSACIRARDTCGLPREDPEYNNFKEAWSEAYKAVEIAWDNYNDIYDRLFR